MTVEMFIDRIKRGFLPWVLSNEWIASLSSNNSCNILKLIFLLIDYFLFWKSWQRYMWYKFIYTIQEKFLFDRICPIFPLSIFTRIPQRKNKHPICRGLLSVWRMHNKNKIEYPLHWGIISPSYVCDKANNYRHPENIPHKSPRTV